MKILFVCTGNICRSPMAAAIARREIERAGYRGMEVASAGIAALVGHGATRDAAAVAAEHGLSLAGHRAQQLTPGLAASADVVVGMERLHVDYAQRLGAGQAVTLSEPVSDPYGFAIGVYRETWTFLSSSVPQLLRECNNGARPLRD